MKTLSHPDQFISRILGTQTEKRFEKSRLMRFCVMHQLPEGLLLFNTITKGLVFLDSSEQHNLLTNDDLFKRWFLVPESFDDVKLLRDLLVIGRTMSTHGPSLSSFTVFTTTACNARCFYCFEKGIKAEHMTLETADKVAEFICNNTPGGQANVKWFGGEPLYNISIIDRICQRIKPTVSLSSSITTNGYLLTPDILPKAKELWNLKSVQISLDGTEKVYNRVKNYIYDDCNAFQTVIRNIKAINSYGFALQIRLNAGRNNVDDLLALVKYLAKEIEDKTLVRVYTAPLFEKDSGFHNTLTSATRTDLFEKIKELDSTIQVLGFPTTLRNVHSFKFYNCEADNPSAIVISPSGDLYRCEHIQSNNAVGSVFNPECTISTGVWTEYLPLNDAACTGCPLLPLCLRPVGCSEVAECPPERRSLKLDRVQNHMLQAYNCKKLNNYEI